MYPVLLIISFKLEKDSIDRKGGMRMFMQKWITRLIAALGIFAVVATLGSVSVFAESVDVTEPMETAKTIEVELKDDNFNPKVITIPNGTTTTLLLKNKGIKEHTFTVEALNIDVEVEPGKEKTIIMKPDKPGTYELICRYHLKEGMVGQVIVK
jgi:plastocyanin